MKQKNEKSALVSVKENLDSYKEEFSTMKLFSLFKLSFDSE